MANAVFNSLESYFSGNKLKPKLDWAKFDMSNIRTMDCDMGILYPFYLEDCLPGDKIILRNTVKVQALPLKNPIFNNFKLYTYYYYVPYYLLWHKFDRFIEGGRDGTYTAELPYVQTPTKGAIKDSSITDETGDEKLWKNNEIFGENTLYDYMGFQPRKYNLDNNIGQNKINAFPFAAYQRIWRDYFMNQDVQTSTNVNRWFPEDDFDFQLVDGENFLLGQDATLDADIISNKLYGDMCVNARDKYENRPMLMALRARNWNKDYFTSMWFSPQRGPVQAVTVAGTAQIDFSNAIGNSIDTSNFGHILTSGNKLIATSTNSTIYDSTQTEHLKNALSTAQTAITSGGFTLADLHLAQQIEIWMIRNMSVKAQYNEFLRIHFDDAPLDERLTKPAYIGGTVQDINISEVLQTSQTTDTSAQGTATGHATSYENGYVGKYYSHEYGLVMGICCIMPEAYYNTGNDRHWTKTSRYDYYFPEFADLEPQAVLKKEMNAGMDDEEGNLPVGYIGRYDEYRHHRSKAVGAFRNDRATDFTSWVLTRKSILGTLGLNQQLISTMEFKTQWKSPAKAWMRVINEDNSYTAGWFYESNIKHDAWATGETINPFIVQIGIGCEMTRALPYVNDPTRQGR